MKILISNLGSTSFKYRLYQMTETACEVLAKGGYERVTNYAEVIEDALTTLQKDRVITSPDEIQAVGFKTVLGKNLSGCVIADETCVKALDDFAAVAPAHNPPYANGIRQFAKTLPNATLVALFETAFYQWIPQERSTYALPKTWRDAGIKRYGFHGASHKFVAERSAELLDRPDIANRAANLYTKGLTEFSNKPLRVISCHLGGSSSITAIHNGVAVATSMGFSPQSGLPQNNRVGDLDSSAIPYAMRTLGITLEEAEKQLTKESGLQGLSGVSNDIRDINQAAQEGNTDAQLALAHLVDTIRHYIGAYAWQMGGLDALVFTAGIGENNHILRTQVCANLTEFGLLLDQEKNLACKATEACISAPDSRVKIFVIPANEEHVLAREVFRKLSHHKKSDSPS